jgi:hypothetical protein
VRRWRGGYGNREAMDFESSLAGRLSVVIGFLRIERARLLLGEGRCRAMDRSLGCRNGFFLVYGHTAMGRGEAHRTGARLNTSLRAIKDADPALLLPQDLLGGQSLDQAHRAPAARALPDSSFTVVRRFDCRRYGGEQSPA